MVVAPPLAWTRAGAAIGLQDLLAHAEGLRGHLDELVVGDELDALLEGELLVGHEADGGVRARGAHVRELLFTNAVDVEIVVARVFADDHALVDFNTVGDEEDTAVLEAFERVGSGGALSVGDESTRETLRNLTLVGDVAVEDGVHDDGAAGLGEHLGAEADETA